MTRTDQRRSHGIQWALRIGAAAAFCACSTTDLSSLTEGDDGPPSAEVDADAPADEDAGASDDAATGAHDGEATDGDAAEADAARDAALDASVDAGDVSDADAADAADDDVDAGPSCVWSDFLSPSKAESVKNAKSDSDSTPWSNVAGAMSVDGSFARSTAGHGPSHFLRVTGFGFGVPTEAEIAGVEIEMWRRAEPGEGGSPDVVDDSVKLQLGSSSTSQGDRAKAGKWPTTVAATTYGGEDDTWGETLTADGVDGDGFGAVLAFRNNSFLDARGAVDAVRIRIRYCVQ